MRSRSAAAALKFHGKEPAELKRMWVADAARGLGIGRRLLGELERRARRRRTHVRLETNRALEEAIGLYRSAGYREVEAFNDEPYAHHWFEKPLEGQADRRAMRNGVVRIHLRAKSHQVMPHPSDAKPTLR